MYVRHGLFLHMSLARTYKYMSCVVSLVLGVAFSNRASSNDLYVTYFYTNEIHKFAADGSDLGTFAITDGFYPSAIAINSQGAVYVGITYKSLSNETSFIRKFSSSGQDLGIVVEGAGISSYGLAIDSNDNLYVADRRQGAVLKFAPDGTNMGVFSSARLFDPFGMAFDHSGHLYVSDRGALERIVKISPTGEDLGIFAVVPGSPDGPEPEALAFDANGNLYTTYHFNSEVHKFGPDGTDLGNFASAGLTGPVGLAFDSDGNLYVANNGDGIFPATHSNTVHKFGPNGEDLGTFINAGTKFGQRAGPVGLAFAPILLQDSQWNIDASGNWSIVGNWTGGIPDAPGEAAVFGDTITGPRTVTIDTPTTVGRIGFDSSKSYTIAGDNALTLDAPTALAQINLAAGNHTISAPVILADNTVITVTPSTSNLSISGPLSAAGMDLTKAGAGTLTLNNVRANGLSINAGTVAIRSSSGSDGTSVIKSLTIVGDATPTAKLDLTNNAAIINYAGTSPAGTIRQQILAGRGGAGLDKQWSGQGITSSAAATVNATEPESHSVGYAENSVLPLGSYTTFRGQPVDDTSLLVAYTRTGDGNLDGIVNDDDVTIVGTSYAPGVPNASWALGDFDYNGFVDDDDVTLLGAFYDPSAAPLTMMAEGPTVNAEAVPEPPTIALATFVIAIALLGVASPRLNQEPFSFDLSLGRRL